MDERITLPPIYDPEQFRKADITQAYGTAVTPEEIRMLGQCLGSLMNPGTYTVIPYEKAESLPEKTGRNK